jgi:hypothetical protein
MNNENPKTENGKWKMVLAFAVDRFSPRLSSLDIGRELFD